MDMAVDDLKYGLVHADCPCGCNGSGWFVCGANGWHSQYAVHLMAATVAVTLLNEGRASEQEVDVLFSSPEDWQELDDSSDDNSSPLN